MEIYEQLMQLLSAGRTLALGTVVWAQGSTPQKAGSQALTDAEGTVWGTLGGGLVEAEGLRRMRDSVATGAPELFEYRLDEPYSREAGPICGGTMRIFVNPAAAQYRTAIEAALAAHASRERGVLATRVDGRGTIGEIRWLAENEIARDDSRAEAFRVALAEERTRFLAEDGESSYFIEAVVPAPRLLIVGGGHVGRATAIQGTLLGFDVTVIDDRPDFADPALFPDGTATVCGVIRDEVASFPKDRDTYIVLVSKGHRPDAEALESCIRCDAAYIGMIGSRRKIESLRRHFVADGLATEDEFDRIVAPIGMDIGAITVPEIGVSIAAQLVAARRQGVASLQGIGAAL